MIRATVLLLLCASFVIANTPATKAIRPTTQPSATQPSPMAQFIEKMRGVNSDSEKIIKAADDKVPSNAELWDRIKNRNAEFDKLLKIGHIDLTIPVMEKSPEFTLWGDHGLITMPGLLDRLQRAKDDKSLKAVLITFTANTGFNFAQAQEIRQALVDLRNAGKRTFVYADGFDTPTYIAASGATDICMLAGGEIMIPGVGLETIFAKGLLDKIGIKADYVQVGEYKGADEMFTRTEPSDEARGELNKIVDGLYEQIVDGIAKNRNIPKSAVKQMIDDCIVHGQAAKDRGFVDHLISQEDLRTFLKTEMGGDINILPRYAMPEPQKIDFSNPLSLLAGLGGKQKAGSTKPAIALIHAEGVIIDGEAEDGLLGPSGNVGSENIRKAFRIAAKDDNIKAIVLRIDSPGGSALASEVMWQAVQAVAKDKPVIISIGGMAASGGYYLASAGDYIFADPSAIVGSIGVVGGKFVLTDLLDKVGVTTESFSRGKNADLFSMTSPWNDRQKRMVTNWMKQTYDQFTQRIMHTRTGKIKDIDKVARGRIFVARQAHELGMVDQLGGLQDAIKYAAGEVDLTEYEIRAIPASKSLIDLISGNYDPEELEARMPWKPQITIKHDSPFLAMPASLRKALMQQLQMMQLLDKRPVMLVSPYVITVK